MLVEGTEQFSKVGCSCVKTGGVIASVLCVVQGIVNVLLEDNLKQELTMAYRTSVQDEVNKSG